MDIPKPDGPDVNIGGAMIRTIWTLYAITIVVVSLRLYVQLVVVRQQSKISHLGEAMMALSVFCGIGLCTCLTIQHHYGLGRHFFFLDDHQRIYAIKYNFIGQAFGVMAPSFGRMSFICLMLQLFGTNAWRRAGLWFLFWQSLVVNALTLILIYVQCEDVQTLWDHAGHPGSCWSPNVQTYTGFAQGALNSATDLILTILPMAIFWKLQMTIRLKIGLGFLLGLSIFAFVACIIKTVQLQSLGQRGDFTFNTVPFFTWVIVECTLVNIAASVPLIRPLFMRAKSTATTAAQKSYELSHRFSSKGSKGARLHSGDLETGIENDSKENILPTDAARIDKETGEIRKNIMMETTYEINYERKNSTTGTPEPTAKAGAWTDARAESRLGMGRR
ncbi:hypothetical protein B0O99DRAFT_623894 [Bisporella sp. PMI_857]|nr:hypothetical protein B0O99DRAFT_623894 [Bisporella sp. PMI_857]